MNRIQKAAAWLGGPLALALAIFFFALAPIVDRILNRVTGDALAPVAADVLRLHQSLIVADLHADQLLWPRDLLDRASHGHVDLPG